MTRILFLAALPFLLLAEDAKDKPKEPPTERALAKEEALLFRLSAAEIQLFQDKYKIRATPAPSANENYEDEIAPINAERQALAKEVCKSVGVPADHLEQCGISTGFDAFGKPVFGPDGKPVPAKVWWVKPQAATSVAPSK